jgi:hypothetical protein
MTDDIVHGTRSAYDAGCRCESCRITGATLARVEADRVMAPEWTI